MSVSEAKITFLTLEELKHSRAFFELSLPRVFPWFLYGAGLLVAAAFLWAAFGEMEVVVRAQAVLRPRVNISELKSAATGVVVSRNFVQGQEVKAGDLLWTLDTRSLEAQMNSVDQQRVRADRQQRVVQEVLDYLTSREAAAPLPSPGTEAGRLVDLHRQEARRLGLVALQAQRDWELEKSLPEPSRAAARLQDLESAALVAQGALDSFLTLQNQKYRDQLKAMLGELETLEAQAAALVQQLAASQVRSPLDGWAEQVRTFNPGDTILAGETLVKIVPKSARDLKAVVSVASNDIAELAAGKTFRLLFPKLPPSEFGQLEGTLEMVPQDAWMLPDAPPVFQLEGSLSRLHLINSRGLKVELKAGMTAEARIIVKRKPVWRFILEKLDFLS